MTGSGASRTETQGEIPSNRLRKRERHLRGWAVRGGVGVYRLYDRDIPEIPRVSDLYRNDEMRAASGALYKRPYEMVGRGGEGREKSKPLS
jgi:23S rRNA G2069 N7-methylase RlmK/C1962 C5-methylase RlmI